MARADIASVDSRKRWRARNPVKDNAHRQVEYFVRRLRRKGLNLPNCEGCGKSEETAKAGGQTIQAHHTDYSRPLDVVWLCATCHIVDHWRHSWHSERNGKAIKYLVSTTVVEQE